MSNIQPRNNIVSIRLHPPTGDGERTTIGGIILPSSHKGSLFDLATIVRVGAGIYTDAGVRIGTGDLKPGMTVLIKRGTKMDMRAIASSVVEMSDSEGDLALIRSDDIIAIVEDPTGNTVARA